MIKLTAKTQVDNLEMFQTRQYAYSLAGDIPDIASTYAGFWYLSAEEQREFIQNLMNQASELRNMLEMVMHSITEVDDEP